ncbi:MAG: NERD domain-containing protein [Alphaproteobacteria bacterium]|nr:NERD domain-containing protein [Alphaproteobacteria bacterium]
MENAIWVIVVFTVMVWFVVRKTRRTNNNWYKWKFFESTRNRELMETVTSADRGTWAERDLVVELLKYGIPAPTIYHDLYVKRPRGDFSQIDLVVPTKVGILVFEIKDYSGWIFGRGNQNNWMQIMGYGRDKYRFYNPIMQNNRHILELQKQLCREKVPFYSIIVFYGNCELKDISMVPRRTYVTKAHRVCDVIYEIMENNEPANYTDKREVMRVLQDAVKNGENTDTENQHIENIRDMLGKDRVFE